VIYNQVGYIFGLNMLANALWLGLFGQDDSMFFGIALIVIIFMLASAVWITNITTHNHLNNWYENIFLRGGMSIYAGWLSSATILNVVFFLKSIGLNTNENLWTKIVLSIAFLIYNSYSFTERNPLFGAVFIWALIAIKDNHKDLEDFIGILLPVHAGADLLIGGFSLYEYFTGSITHGLFF